MRFKRIRALRLPTLSFVAVLCALAFVLPSARAQSALDLQGKPADPLRATHGMVAVLVFVRTDCPISNRYAPVLQKLSADFAGKAKFWLVYPDKRTTARQIREHLQQFRYSISPLRDPGHVLVKLASATITPEAAVFDPRGHLLYHGRIDNWYEDAARARPAATTHELQSVLEAAVAGQPSPVTAKAAVGCYISDLE
jgi:thiol-disulfide isomerase/thioredoxin